MMRKGIISRFAMGFGIVFVLMLFLGAPILSLFTTSNAKDHRLPLETRLLHEDKNVRAWALIDAFYASYSLNEAELVALLKHIRRYFADEENYYRGVVVSILQGAGLMADYVLINEICAIEVDESLAEYKSHLVDLLREASPEYAETGDAKASLCDSLADIYLDLLEARRESWTPPPIEED